MKYLSLFAIGVAMFIPDTVLAQAGGFVPCSGTDCSLCHLAQMGNTLLQWLIGLLFVVFAVMVAIAGFGLVTSGGNPSAKQAAKDKLVNALIGIIIVLAAWLLVDTLIRGLVGTSGQINGNLWYSVSCQTQRTPTTVAPGFPPPTTGQFSYQVYEEDTTNNCKIPLTGSDPVQATCSAAQAAAISSAAGATYIVQDCDPAATLPSPPAWSSLPACGLPSTACTPLTPYTGPDPLGLVWTGADPGLQNCAQNFAASAGGTINSAYRPQAYQDHLKEIHTKWCAQGLSTNTSPACSTVKAAVSGEMSMHGLNCSWPVANVSNHTGGLAVDISFPGGDPGTSGNYNLTWFGPGDPVHYTFAAGSTCP